MAVPTAPPSSEGDAGGNDGILSFIKVVSKPAPPPSFKPGFIFTEPNMLKAAEDFQFALVLKFVRVRPTIDDICLAIIKLWGLLEISTMQAKRDFVHGWAREGRLIAGSIFRLFRWTKDFDLRKESTFVRFLGIDNATLHRTRASGARLCIEIDLTEEPMQHFPIVVVNRKFWQEARYERPGFYCKKCYRQGHTSVVCRAGEGLVRKGRDVAKGVVMATREDERVYASNVLESSTMKLVGGPGDDNKTEEQPSIQIENTVTVREEERVSLEVDDEWGGCSSMEFILVDASKSPGYGGRGQAVVVSEALDMECHVKPVAVDVAPVAMLYGTDVEEEDNVLHMAKHKGYDSDDMQNPASSIKQKNLVLHQSQRKNNGSIVALFEPFAREDKLKRLVSSLGFDGYFCNEVEWGKIWILWRAPYDFEVASVSTQMIMGCLLLEGIRTLVSFMYAKCTQCRSNAHPWIVMGDFNIIREDRECVGGCPRAAQAIDDFNKCIDSCRLVELNFCGNPLSWCNGQEGTARKWARLDRMLMNMVFLERFNMVELEYIKRKTSDHSPMVVCLSRV
ncbi:hypothetical protein I3843_07G070600 [Carya illinoinensis]|nr:hypothetical protein I3843_07G070600 [Carya illinoinensis]